MNILAIETSCDETALSIITTDSFDSTEPQFHVLSDLVISQIDIHAQYGGVFPAMAKREHAKNLTPLLEQSLKNAELYTTSTETTSSIGETQKEILDREPETFDALCELFSNIQKPKIDMIMVTHGPGLAPALWVGVNFARALATLWDIPLVPVNHMEGHITSVLLREDYSCEKPALQNLDSIELPLISLLISGGHTQVVLVKDWGDYEIIGETIDDAVGEAYDKVGRMLDMDYPGGPKVAAAAAKGKENDDITLPRPMMHSGDYRFSFSGLKTAVRYLIQDLKESGTFSEDIKNDIAKEFQEAVSEVLIKKVSQSIEEYNAKGLIIAGGVSANSFITNNFQTVCDNYDISLYLPERKLCGDNSLMIATAGFLQYWKNKKATDPNEVVAVGNLKL